MFAEDLDGARLRAFLAHLLDVADPRAWRDLCCVTKNAIAVEVYFLTIGAAEKAKLAARINPHDGAYRLIFVLLGLASHQPCLILQSSAGAPEGIVDSEGQVGVTFILLGRTSNIDLTTIRECKPNAHLILTPALVVITGPLHDDATCGEPAKTALEFRNVLLDDRLEFGRGLKTLKFDLSWRLHDFLHFSQAIGARLGLSTLTKINPVPEMGQLWRPSFAFDQNDFRIL